MKDRDVLQEARRLHALGFAVHWLHPKSKRPIGDGWTTGPRKEWHELEKTHAPGNNVGVRLGTPSKLAGGFLAVIDVDLKSEDPKHHQECIQAFATFGVGELSPAVVSGRGPGSGHYYFVTRRPFKAYTPVGSPDDVHYRSPSKRVSKKELAELTEKELADGIRIGRAWEISLYSEGRHVVLPPSVHPDSGNAYRWGVPFSDAWEIPVRDDLLPPDPGAPTPAREPCQTPDDFEFEVSDVELAWLPLSAEVRSGIVHGTGVTDRSGYLLRAATALVSAGLSENEVLTVLTDPDTFLGECAYEHAQTKSRARAAAWLYRYTLKKVSAERRPETVFSETPAPRAVPMTAEEKESENRDFKEMEHWTQNLTYEPRTRKPLLTLTNLDLILVNDVAPKLFIEDQFVNRIRYGVDTPWGGQAGANIHDIDLTLLKHWLGTSEWAIEPSTNLLLEGTSLIAHRCRVHPVRDWLNGLAWDGVPRIGTWIKKYCKGVAPEPYLYDVSKKFLVAMVKRVFEPGCQMDYVLVLEGNQGERKSSVARALASDAWFMDNLPDLKDKDAMLNLQGKWLIELAELAEVKRADFNQVKAYLSRRVDTVRAHYGRLVSDIPRQSVFIGTINEGQYLKDPTGNRRYWPVKVGMSDTDGLKAVRDQLFAEAVHVYRKGEETLFLSGLSEAQAKESQEDRRVDDDESEMRESLIEFAMSPEGKEFDFQHFKARDLCVGNGSPWGRFTTRPYHLNTAAQALHGLGFQKRKIKGQRIWKIGPEVIKKYPDFENFVGATGHRQELVVRHKENKNENDENDEIDFF